MDLNIDPRTASLASEINVGYGKRAKKPSVSLAVEGSRAGSESLDIGDNAVVDWPLW
jgi:hypothetical protein